jgi:hypothetical protein
MDRNLNPGRLCLNLAGSAQVRGILARLVNTGNTRHIPEPHIFLPIPGNQIYFLSLPIVLNCFVMVMSRDLVCN